MQDGTKVAQGQVPDQDEPTGRTADRAWFEASVTAARTARDWPALLDIARRFGTAHPEHPAAYRHEAMALVEMGDLDSAETVLAHAVQRFAGHPILREDYASLAERRGDAAAALRRWLAASRRFPDHAQIAVRAAKALQSAGRMQEAEHVLGEARERLAESLPVLRTQAELSVARQDWREAVRRFTDIRARFPKEVLGYAGICRPLLQLGDTASAEAEVQAGLTLWPENVELLMCAAQVAVQRKDWAAAEQRWRAVMARLPLNPLCIAGLATALLQQERHADAEMILRAGMEALPRDPLLSARFAQAATAARDWPEAVRRWRLHQTRFPDDPLGYAELGRALKRAGDGEAAEAVLLDGMHRMPDDHRIAAAHAWSAYERGDYVEGLRRWDALVARHPDRLEVREGRQQARLAMESGDDVRSSGVADGDWPADLPPASLLARFESLGNNCEFGLLQRHFGLEPISLFRWASVSMSGLIHGLEEGFTDVGNPANVVLRLPAPGTEFQVSDKAYRFGMHTFVKDGSVQEEKFFKEQCRRLSFLARKLREDLAAGERIFVYKHNAPVDDSELLRLHRAIRRFGNGRLLVVQRADAAHPNGMLRLIEDGLAMGYLAHFGNDTKPVWTVDTQTWVQLCRRALDVLNFAKVTQE